MLMNSCCLLVLVLLLVDFTQAHLEDELPMNSPDMYFRRRIPKDYYQRSNLADCHARFHDRRVQVYQTTVFGGVKVNDTEFPHMAVLGWGNGAGGYDWRCGGSLITKRFVLTAAHCVLSEGKNPTVVRLGDVNLASGADDSFAQQLNIKNIKRHPQHSFKEKYFDLALIELENDVVLTPGVCPACIWMDQTYPYETLDIAGFGATGFAEDNSPDLLKARIAPVDQTTCSQAFPAGHGLSKGIAEDQLCAVGVNSDSCPGDSGGPLQTTLHTYHRRVALLVGVTSFGSACGLGSYGVYQRIVPHRQWLESIVGEPLDPLTCIKNYEAYLQQEQLSMEYEAVDAYFSRVYIRWDDPKEDLKCGGTLIDYNTVVTTAHCTYNSKQESPKEVSILGQRNRISKILRHPKFQVGSYYNDIALLRLNKYLRKSDIIAPPCLPYPRAVDALVTKNRSISIRLPKAGLEPKLQIYLPAKGKCDELEVAGRPDYIAKLPKGLTKFLSCFKADYELVPELGGFDIGGPLLSRDESVMFGINVFARDGGSYSPLITLNIARFIPWIEQFVLERQTHAANTGSSQESVDYQDTYLYEGSPCTTNDRLEGHCHFANECRRELERYRYRLVRPAICGYKGYNMLICCPVWHDHHKRG